VFDTDLEGFCRSDNEAYSDGGRKLEGDSRLQRLIQQAKGSFPTAQVVTNAGDRPAGLPPWLRSHRGDLPLSTMRFTAPSEIRFVQPSGVQSHTSA
jgi:hypothetical protein